MFNNYSTLVNASPENSITLPGYPLPLAETSHDTSLANPPRISIEFKNNEQVTYLNETEVPLSVFTQELSDYIPKSRANEINDIQDVLLGLNKTRIGLDERAMMAIRRDIAILSFMSDAVIFRNVNDNSIVSPTKNKDAYAVVIASFCQATYAEIKRLRLNKGRV